LLSLLPFVESPKIEIDKYKAERINTDTTNNSMPGSNEVIV